MSRIPAWRWSPYQSPLQPLFLPDLLGPLDLITPPSGQVVTLAQAKAQVRQDGTQDDTLITGLIEAATEFCEQEAMGALQFRTATFNVPVVRWWEGPLRLPRPPLQSVVSVTYYDTGGNVQTLDSSVYLVRTPWRRPGTIERAPFQVWPSYQADRRYPILVQFRTGYPAGQVPQPVQQAVLVAVTWMYEKRGPEEEELSSIERVLSTCGYAGYG